MALARVLQTLDLRSFGGAAMRVRRGGGAPVGEGAGAAGPGGPGGAEALPEELMIYSQPLEHLGQPRGHVDGTNKLLWHGTRCCWRGGVVWDPTSNVIFGHEGKFVEQCGKLTELGWQLVEQCGHVVKECGLF